MEITIDNRTFGLGGQRFAFSFYFMEAEDVDRVRSGESVSTGEICKWLLGKWANALERINADSCPTFLPFMPDDQEIECFKVEYNDGSISFTHVEVAEDGWALDWNDIEGFVVSHHETYDRLYVPIGVFDKVEVIAALRNARVVGEGSGS